MSTKAVSNEPPIKYETGKFVKVCRSGMHEDVFDRLDTDGCEDYFDYDYGNRIYLVKTIKEILEDPEDDTNETTRFRLHELYQLLAKEKARYLIIIND